MTRPERSEKRLAVDGRQDLQAGQASVDFVRVQYVALVWFAAGRLQLALEIGHAGIVVKNQVVALARAGHGPEHGHDLAGIRAQGDKIAGIEQREIGSGHVSGNLGGRGLGGRRDRR